MSSPINTNWNQHLAEIEEHRDRHTPSFINVWMNYLQKSPREQAFSTGFDKSHYEIMLHRLNLAINLFENCDPNIEDQLIDCKNEIGLADYDLVLITADLDKTAPLSFDEKRSWEKTHRFATQILSQIDQLILF